MAKRISITVLVIIALAVILSIAGRLVYKHSQARQERAPERITISVACAKDTLMREMLTYTGMIEGYNQVTVLSQTAGTVEKISMSVGRYCSAGTVLATVANTMQQAVLDQAEAQKLAATTNLRKAQKDLERMTRLANDKAIPENELENVQLNSDACLAQLKSAEAQVSIARKNYNDTYIKSPITGRIAGKMLDVGATVMMGSPVAVIVDDSRFKIKISVSEMDLSRVSAGQDVSVIVDAFPKMDFKGRIETIGGVPEGQARTYPVTVVMSGKQNESLRPGMFCRCAIALRVLDSALTIPETALLTASDGSISVFVVRDKKHAQIPIQVGFKYAGRYVVTSGLTPGDTVVTTGKERLTSASAEIVIAGE
jgi:RND family efflux transporter MFP subunit